MTDEENITKITNKNKEQETIESDIEDENDEESYCSGDKSNVTTDDEFYNELMAAPAEYEDHLILDDCKDEIIGIEHLSACLNRRYNACPVFYTGTLKDAVKAAFNSKEKAERRPLLIYINNDKSMYSNLFCKQLLCHEKIIDYLLNNYVLWAWDVTFPSNGEKLTEIFKGTFSQWNTDKNIGTKSIEQYPMLIGVYHNKNGDFQFSNLIYGSNNRPDIDEFLARLIELKDRFDIGEDEFERQNQMNSSFRTPELNYSSTFNRDQDFSYSTFMNFNRNPSEHPRFLNNDRMNFNRHPADYSGFSNSDRIHNLPMSFNRNPPESSGFLNNDRINLITTLLGHLNNNPNDGDNEDDDNNGEEQTPTVNHPSLQFPK